MQKQQHTSTQNNNADLQPLPHGAPARYRNKSVRFPGAMSYLKEVGVSYPHFYRVMTGDRKNDALKEDYLQWAASRGFTVNL